MSGNQRHVLIVDDEPVNLEILSEFLEDSNFRTVSAENGESAWQLLLEKRDFDAVILDRMMPGLDGLELLNRIKSHDELCTLPVILQTGKAAEHEVLEGLQAGAEYYLTKPYEKQALLAIVQTSVADFIRYKELREKVGQQEKTLDLLDEAEFTFRTLEEASNLASLLAKACPDPQATVLGLSELLINAVEHGNLGISYNEKSELNENNQWLSEVCRRLNLSDNQHKKVTVRFFRTTTELVFNIQDQGEGFEWQKYMEICPERAFDNHGKGIAIANAISFDHIDYLGNGSEVVVKIGLKTKTH